MLKIVMKENKTENIIKSLCKVLVCLHLKFCVQFYSLFQRHSAPRKGQVNSGTGNQWWDADCT